MSSFTEVCDFFAFWRRRRSWRKPLAPASMTISVLVLSSSSVLLDFFAVALVVDPPPVPIAPEFAARSSVNAEFTTGVTGGRRTSAGFGVAVAAALAPGVMLAMAASTAEVVASVIASRTVALIVPSSESSPPKRLPKIGAATRVSSCIWPANHESKSSSSSPSIWLTLVMTGVACRGAPPRPPF